MKTLFTAIFCTAVLAMNKADLVSPLAKTQPITIKDDILIAVATNHDPLAVDRALRYAVEANLTESRHGQQQFVVPEPTFTVRRYSSQEACDALAVG